MFVKRRVILVWRHHCNPESPLSGYFVHSDEEGRLQKQEVESASFGAPNRKRNTFGLTGVDECFLLLLRHRLILHPTLVWYSLSSPPWPWFIDVLYLSFASAGITVVCHHVGLATVLSLGELCPSYWTQSFSWPLVGHSLFCCYRDLACLYASGTARCIMPYPFPTLPDCLSPFVTYPCCSDLSVPRVLQKFNFFLSILIAGIFFSHFYQTLGQEGLQAKSESYSLPPNSSCQMSSFLKKETGWSTELKKPRAAARA